MRDTCGGLRETFVKPARLRVRESVENLRAQLFLEESCCAGSIRSRWGTGKWVEPARGAAGHDPNESGMSRPCLVCRHSRPHEINFELTPGRGVHRAP